jgi:undecaprenyl diphosphate synthase
VTSTPFFTRTGFMTQSDLTTDGMHVAIIMDGNGRWAQARGKPRTAGHLAGAAAVRRVIESAPALGIRTLTLYAFSSDNWKRPRPEVSALMRLLERYLRTETASCVEQGVCLRVIGRRDRLPERVQRAIADAEHSTAAGGTLQLRLAIDYSSRDELVRAAAQAPQSRDELAQWLSQHMAPADVDLVIRTGGEQRLSDFLLWESAFAELYFTPIAWPDFDRRALAAAIAEFARRQRRFGAVHEATAVAS